MEEDTEKPILNIEPQNKRKRRFSSSNLNKENTNSETDAARENKFRIIDGPRQFRLLDFSDEMLYEIFQYLDTWTLMALMNSCSRLSSFVLDNRFWKFIDLSKEPLPLGILEDVLERSHANTVSIKIHGPPISQHIEGEDKQFSLILAKVFTKFCTNLRILELQGITIDFRHVHITEFPKTLQRLQLNNCHVRFEFEKSIFLGIETHLTKLEELAIENSGWFEPYYMMVLSKLPELRSLSLKGCQLLSDFVPYGSMAARFGFKKLEFLDLRFTPISDSDLQCFNAVTTLKEVLLECPEWLREALEQDVAKNSTKVQNCYCPSRQIHQNNTNHHSARPQQGDSPSTSAAAASTSSGSQWKVTVSLASNCPSTSTSNNNNEQHNGTPPTSSVASTETSPSPSSQSLSNSQSSSSSSAVPVNSVSPPKRHLAIQLQRDDDYSSSSGSSSPTSTSSNESFPPLLANSPRLNNLELPMPGGNAPPFSRFLPRPDQIILLDLNNRWRHSALNNIASHRENRGGGEQPQPQQPQPQRHAHPNDNPILNNFHPNNINNNNNNAENNNGNHNQNGNQIDQVLNHPLFWDMINPFARVGPGLRRNGRDEADEAFDTPPRRFQAFDCRRSNCSGQYHQYHRHRHRLHHQPISDRGVCCFGRPRNPVEHGIIWIRIGNRPSENRFERLSIRNYKMVTDISLQHLVQCSPFLIYLDLSGTSVTQRGIDTFKEIKPECTVRADHLYEIADSIPVVPDAPEPSSSSSSSSPSDKSKNGVES